MRGLWVLLALTGCDFRPTGTGAELPDARHTDAAPADARGTDALVHLDSPAPLPTCPASYHAVGNTTSRYRAVNGDDRTWHAAEAACEADQLAGGWATHLLVLETSAEADTLVSGLPGLAAFADYWIGMVQPLGQEQKYQGWRWVTGDQGLARWSVGEPDDGVLVGSEDDREQFASAGSFLTFDDRPGTQALRRICECDNKAVDPTVPVPP